MMRAARRVVAYSMRGPAEHDCLRMCVHTCASLCVCVCAVPKKARASHCGLLLSTPVVPRCVKGWSNRVCTSPRREREQRGYTSGVLRRFMCVFVR